MANNRIFIVNKITRKYICIAKHMGGPWYSRLDSDLNLKDFFDDEENEKSFWKNEHCYELIYEDDPLFNSSPFDLKGFPECPKQ